MSPILLSTCTLFDRTCHNPLVQIPAVSISSFLDHWQVGNLTGFKSFQWDKPPSRSMDSAETRSAQGSLELSNEFSSMSLHADGLESATVSGDTERIPQDLDNSESVSGGTPSIPQDLWPNIVSELAFESLENVIFTCRYFHTLAQPLFFSTLAVKHVNMLRRPPFPYVYRRSADEEEWIFDKLRFYSSDSVARRVQFCRIAPRYTVTEESPSVGRLPGYEDDGREIVHRTFNLIPMFINLTSIHLECVRLTHENLIQLASASSLERAVLISCGLPAGYSPVSLSIKNVLMNDFNGTNHRSLISSVVNPDIIESLCMLRFVAFATVSNPRLYRNLKTLCIDATHSDLSTFPTFFEEVPSLRELIFYNTKTLLADHDFPAILPHTIPHLESFEGPLEWAHNFTGSRTIRHLSVWAQGVPLFSRDYLARILDGFVESLTLKISTLDVSLLSTVFERSPNLKALEILSHEVDTKVSHVENHKSNSDHEHRYLPTSCHRFASPATSNILVSQNQVLLTEQQRHLCSRKPI